MLSEEIKEAVEKLVQEQMSDYCERTNATIARLMKENKKLEELIHKIYVGLDERIINVLSGMPRNFLRKIFEMDLQKTEVVDTSQAELSFPNDWSREENDSLEEEDGPYKTAVDFNDTKFQKIQEESPESNIRKDAKIQKENERKCKIVHELNNKVNQLMSLEAGLLLVQTSEVKGYQKEIVRPKNDSNQPMSLEAGLLLVEASKVKNDPKEIVDLKHDSNQPMSLEAGLLLVEASKVKNDPKEIVDLKNDSNQPMSLEAGLLLVEASKVKNDPKEIVDPKNDSNQPMSLEAGLLLVEASKVKNDPKEIVGLKNDSNQPMSLEAGLLLVEASKVKNDPKEIVDPKNDSNQPTSLEAGLLLVEASKVKNDPKEIVDPKNDSNQPMSLEAGLLLVEASKVKNDPKEIVDLKNDSNQPMSLETSYEVYASKDAHCSRHDVKVGSSSETLVFPEADLNTKKEFSQERPVSGECTGAKGKIDLQASGIKQEKKESSKRQESSKSGKMKNPFLQFKKKGNTNH